MRAGLFGRKQVLGHLRGDVLACLVDGVDEAAQLGALITGQRLRGDLAHGEREGQLHLALARAGRQGRRFGDDLAEGIEDQRKQAGFDSLPLKICEGGQSWRCGYLDPNLPPIDHEAICKAGKANLEFAHDRDLCIVMRAPDDAAQEPHWPIGW